MNPELVSVSLDMSGISDEGDEGEGAAFVQIQKRPWLLCACCGEYIEDRDCMFVDEITVLCCSCATPFEQEM